MIRQKQDFYPTPLSAFLPLLPYIDKAKLVWEPASGDGRLIKCLLENGFIADGLDLNRGYNFFLDNERRECIITNPPFSAAKQFVQHSLEVSSEVFLLLRLNFLGSQKRHSWWKECKPQCLFVLSERPSFVGKGTDMTDYAWYYWGDRFHGIEFLASTPI